MYDVGLGNLIVAQEILSFLGGNVRGRVSDRRLVAGTPRTQGSGLARILSVQTSELGG